MRRLLLPLLAVAVVGLVAALVLHRLRPHGRLYEDLAPSAELRLASGEPAPWHDVVCADETHPVVSIESGDRIEVPVSVPRAAFLELGGCTTEDGLNAWDPPGEVEVELRVGGELVGGETVDLDGAWGWWLFQVDLSAHGGRSAVLSVVPRLPAGRTLHLREAYFSFPAPGPLRWRPPPQVLLVSADTLRADQIGALGGSARTPALDRLVAESETFERHFAAAHWTKPSHASLLTGELPGVHGAELFDQGLRPSVPTLASRLSTAGFTTAGLVYDCPWLAPEFGFARGFGEYRVEHWPLSRSVRTVIGWVEAHAREPFFFFFHTFETHSDFTWLPYESPGTSRSWVGETHGLEAYGCSADGACASARLEAVNAGRVEPRPGEAAVLAALYGRSVEHLDHELGKLFDGLRALGLWDDLLVIVTSDHGEELLDHGRTLHTSPWNEVLEVPLLVKWPRDGRAGRVHPGPSSALDVVPTILARVGVDATGLPGFDLRSRPPTEPVFGGSRFHYVVAGASKLVLPEAGEPWLVDLATDPEEEAPVAVSAEEPLLGLLRRRLEADDRRGERAGGVPSIELSGVDRRRLEALGYAGP